MNQSLYVQTKSFLLLLLFIESYFLHHRLKMASRSPLKRFGTTTRERILFETSIENDNRIKAIDAIWFRAKINSIERIRCENVI